MPEPSQLAQHFAVKYSAWTVLFCVEKSEKNRKKVDFLERKSENLKTGNFSAISSKAPSHQQSRATFAWHLAGPVIQQERSGNSVLPPSQAGLRETCSYSRCRLSVPIGCPASNSTPLLPPTNLVRTPALLHVFKLPSQLV